MLGPTTNNNEIQYEKLARIFFFILLINEKEFIFIVDASYMLYIIGGLFFRAKKDLQFYSFFFCS